MPARQRTARQRTSPAANRPPANRRGGAGFPSIRACEVPFDRKAAFLKRFRFRKQKPLLLSLAAVALVVLAYILGTAWVQSRLQADYSFRQLIQPRVVDVVIVSWLVYFCSSIGSFLNVVAWRMPRGESIGGRSRCPRCAAKLKSRDNFPVLGWISLRGRCRTCGLPISRRYPIVEGLVGGTLAVLGVGELYSFSLPAQQLYWHGSPMWTPRVTGVLLLILTYHAAAVATLWAMTLIRIDGVRIPTPLVTFGGLILVLPMLGFPTLMVVPWQAIRPPNWNPDGLYFDAVMRVVSGLVAAAFFARVLAKGLCPTADLKLDPLGRGTARLIDLVAMLAIPGVLIGWQSMPAFVVLSAVAAFALRPLLRTIPINDGPQGQLERRGAMEAFAFALPIAATLHLTCWRLLWSSPFWPSDRSGSTVVILWGLASLAAPLFLREPSSNRQPHRPTPTVNDSTSGPQANVDQK